MRLRPIIGSLLMALIPAAGEAQVPAGFAELGPAEIRRALSGLLVMPDPNVRQRAMRYGEVFYPDGTWRSSREERALLMLSGRWSVQAGSVCVTVDWISRESSRQPRHDCRKLWRNARTGQLAMTDRDRPAGPLILASRPAPPPVGR
jgi:hypothetical protein